MVVETPSCPSLTRVREQRENVGSTANFIERRAERGTHGDE